MEGRGAWGGGGGVLGARAWNDFIQSDHDQPENKVGCHKITIRLRARLILTVYRFLQNLRDVPSLDHIQCKQHSIFKWGPCSAWEYWKLIIARGASTYVGVHLHEVDFYTVLNETN